MAGQQPQTGRRGPASAWSRLKAPVVDALEVYGLPSKGETRLNDFKAQENYYNKIVERYMNFCANAGGGDELDRQFSGLSLSTGNPAPPVQPLQAISKTSTPLAASKWAAVGTSPSQHASPADPLPLPMSDSSNARAANGKADLTAIPPSRELQLLHSAMRKLREATTATHRHDTFTQRCYIFIIRASLLTQSWETYHPSLLYLLSTIHRHTPLSQSELKEFVNYRVLDEACRIGDIAEACRVRVLWSRYSQGRTDDPGVHKILKSLAHDDWHQFWRMRRAVNGYQRALMGWAEEIMRVHTLKCLGKSYFVVEKAYVERCAGMSWDKLLRIGVGWELNNETGVVTIRKAKVRAPTLPGHGPG